MKKAIIKFKFYFSINESMVATSIGVGHTKVDAESKAWQNLSKDNFNRNLILKTFRIDRLEIKFETATEKDILKYSL